MTSQTDHTPRHHTQKMQKTHRVREDIETSAEVLGGLIKAFRDYAQKNEPAWRDSRRRV